MLSRCYGRDQTGASHEAAVVLAMAGQRLEHDHRKTRTKRLQAGQSASVLDQDIARGHEFGKTVGKPKDCYHERRVLFERL